MRAFVELWDEITRERYGVTDPKHRLFRYGVQVNSLGLTEQQAENNVYRILLEMLAVTLSKKARARAVQLPAWNEALGLPRPWDQQWSLTDAADPRLRDRPAGVRRHLRRLDRDRRQGRAAEGGGEGGARHHRGHGRRGGGDRLHEAAPRREQHRAPAPHRDAARRSSSASTSGPRPSPRPLSAGEGAIMVVDPAMEADQIEQLKAWRAARDAKAVKAALAELERAAKEGAQHHGAVDCLRARRASRPASGARPCARCSASTARRPASRRRRPRATAPGLEEVRKQVEAVSAKLGRRMKFLVGKPGLDGHSNGAEQIAVRARDCGMEVVYEGIRLTPAQIARAALDEAVHVVGLSILSGSHVPLVREVVERMRKEGLEDVPVVVGGIIPPEDAKTLKAMGVAAVYTPKDFQLNDIMADIVKLVAEPAMAA